MQSNENLGSTPDATKHLVSPECRRHRAAWLPVPAISRLQPGATRCVERSSRRSDPSTRYPRKTRHTALQLADEVRRCHVASPFERSPIASRAEQYGPGRHGSRGMQLANYQLYSAFRIHLDSTECEEHFLAQVRPREKHS